MNTEKNDILTPEDVMEYLDIGKNSVYDILNSGELKAFKIGRKWKIPRKELDNYINNQVNSMERN